MVIVNVKWIMIEFIMGSVLYQWVGWAALMFVTLMFEDFSKGRLKAVQQKMRMTWS